MNPTKQLTIAFSQATFTIFSTSEGMYNLNHIHQGFDLAVKHSPKNWKNQNRMFLESSGNLYSENGGKNQGTYGTEMACYQYAAWVSPEFNAAVFEAFTALRNGHIVKAISLVETVAPRLHEMASSFANKKSTKAHWKKPFTALANDIGIVKATKVALEQFSAVVHLKGDNRLKALETLKTLVVKLQRDFDLRSEASVDPVHAIYKVSRYTEALRLIELKRAHVAKNNHTRAKSA